MGKYKKIGIIVADNDEYIPFRDFILNDNNNEYKVLNRGAFNFKINDTEIVVVNSGIGKTNAAAFTSKCICDGCDVILNYGLSGGIDKVKRGQFTIPTRFVEHDIDFTALGYKYAEKPCQDYYIYDADTILVDKLSKVFPNAILGTAASGDQFVSDKEKIILLKKSFDAVSCDMETAAIASVCFMANIPFASLRRVSDGGEDNYLELYREMNINSGNVLIDCFYNFLTSIC